MGDARGGLRRERTAIWALCRVPSRVNSGKVRGEVRLDLSA
jgi:hypothetical protein